MEALGARVLAKMNPTCCKELSRSIEAVIEALIKDELASKK